MLSQIIKKEIRDHMVSLRFIILFALCVVLIPLSFYINYQSYKISASNYTNLVNSYQREFESAKEEDQDYPDPAGFHPPSSMSVFTQGFSDIIPISFSTTKTGHTWGDSPIASQTMLPLFGSLDFLFIVKIVVSLLAFLMTFDVVAGEKEKGTLKIALSNPVPRHKVILGKFIGGYLTILAALLISVLIGMVIVSFLSFPLFSGEVLSQFLLILLVSFIYLALMFALGLFVSSRCHSSLSAFTILLLLWVVLILAFPSLSDIVARIVYPVKSEQVLNQEKAEVRSNILREKGKELSQAVQKAGLYRGDTRLSRQQEWEQYMKLRQPIAGKYEKREAELIRKLEQDYQRTNTTQKRIAVNISRLSPASTLTYIMSDLCRTGLQEKENFYQQAKVYYQQLHDIYYSKMWMDMFPMDGYIYTLGHYAEGIAERKDLPFFTYKSRGLGAVLSRSVVDIGILVIYTFIFFLGAYFSFLRYDVR